LPTATCKPGAFLLCIFVRAHCSGEYTCMYEFYHLRFHRATTTAVQIAAQSRKLWIPPHSVNPCTLLLQSQYLDLKRKYIDVTFVRFSTSFLRHAKAERAGIIKSLSDTGAHVNVKLSLCLTNHNGMKTYRGVGV
jgi:hypothetical protein